jgi:hypothetical protein
VIEQEGSPLLLHDPFYGNTFLCCLQQHRDHGAYPSLRVGNKEGNNYYDGNFNPQSLVEYWNGTKWSIANNPNPGTFENILWGVTRIPNTPKAIWTVGITSNQLGSGQAFTERYC